MKPNQLENVIKELHAEAYIWARQCCNFDACLAEDILQQVYLKILEGKARFNGQSSTKTWLFAVIRYTAIENFKKENHLFPLEESMDLIIEEEPEETVGSHEKLIQMLPEKQREVMLLVFYHGLTLEKSAEVMGIHIGTVRTHYDRAKKNLKTLILNKKAHEQAG
ncbi:RNA polymerase sigma factor [Mongoliibacter ruber]|uniref:RNA polymerase sigma factor n=1 Tax=Mongoliibacter ruber TaxID=1750599 RepID=A0A2T0WM34_9BACT|nr:RNA polymerase sigma factor [Mongoliibacter ruber]PRY87584.1 RNA polymerase sigma-70 factor (ECF subfamily) [Mongoliibacter ruber]